MPVIDHAVHERTKEAAGALYGCHNRTPFSAGYYAPNGYDTPMEGFVSLYARIKRDFIEHRMSTECRYDMSLADAKCEGCAHRGSGEAYDAMVRGAGK